MRILAMADIHIGSIKDIQYFYKTMTDIIDKEIVMGKIDLVVILGDYFDKLFKNNEDFTSLAINIMSYLVRACSRRKTKIRIIYGTESHEMNQYRLFNYHLTSTNIDMKIIESVKEEEIDGKKILYLPEEYIDDKHRYYKDTLYSDKHYDFIFGHGIIEEGMPMATVSTSKNNTEKQVPRFKSGELSQTCDLCLFGHYHKFTKVCDNVYYVGSLFRSSFGEEEPKGYGIISDEVGDEENDITGNSIKHSFTFIENKAAYPYITFEFNPTSEIYNSEENLINTVKQIKEEHKELFDGITKGKIRLKFQTPSNLDPKFKDILKSILFDEKFITTTIKDSNDELISEIEEDIEDEYDFIIDSNIKIIDKIDQFMKKEYDYHMPMSKLHQYLDKSLEQLSMKKE
jgi:predicted phosphodiesterase